jgi:hypothetical protein
MPAGNPLLYEEVMRTCGRLIALFFALTYAQTLVAQGCAVCGNNAASAPEAEQRGLRRGIAVLLLPTMGIIGAFGVVLYRNRR